MGLKFLLVFEGFEEYFLGSKGVFVIDEYDFFFIENILSKKWGNIQHDNI